jgi:predicted phosphodiesterase
MRLAVFADIHGNLAAFEAALAHAQRQAHDALIILGDIVVGAPDSAACWRLARDLGVPIVRGNHDRTVAYYGTPQADPAWDEPRYGPLHWAAAELSAAERAELAALPTTLRLADAPDLLALHASLRSDHDSVLAYTPAADLAQMFPEPDATLIVRGHNHIVAQHTLDAATLISVGAVGMALDGAPRAQYTTLERRRDGWRAIHHALPYDVAATLARFEATGYLEQTGPLGRLFRRQVATGANQIYPFFVWYERWRAAGPIGLETALARDLDLYSGGHNHCAPVGRAASRIST